MKNELIINVEEHKEKETDFYKGQHFQVSFIWNKHEYGILALPGQIEYAKKMMQRTFDFLTKFGEKALLEK